MLQNALDCQMADIATRTDRVQRTQIFLSDMLVSNGLVSAGIKIA